MANSFQLFYDTSTVIPVAPTVVVTPLSFTITLDTDIDVTIPGISVVQTAGPGILTLGSVSPILFPPPPPGTLRWQLIINVTVPGTYDYDIVVTDLGSNTTSSSVTTNSLGGVPSLDISVFVAKVSNKVGFKNLVVHILKPIDPSISAFQIRMRKSLVTDPPWVLSPGWTGASFIEPGDTSFPILGDNYGIYRTGTLSYLPVGPQTLFPLQNTNILTPAFMAVFNSFPDCVIRIEIDVSNHPLLDISNDRFGTRYAINAFSVDTIGQVSEPEFP